MNKFMAVMGVAALAVVSGCKDPDYKYGNTGATAPANEVKPIATEVPLAPIDVTPTPTPVHCQCPAGTRHAQPCGCGASDCRCVVEVKPLPVTPSAEPETTVYIVQRGDMLSKIAQKYHLKVAAIKELNGLKSDKINIGQKLKLPGKIDVGAQAVPEGAFAPSAAKPAKKPYAPYTGATKTYEVKSGDSLSKIAASCSLSTRQLKELNGLKGDNIRIGQKLKIADKSGEVTPAAKPVDKPAVATSKVTESVAVPMVEPEKSMAVVPESAPAAEPEGSCFVHTVAEGEDLVELSINFNVSTTAIRELNGFDMAHEIKAGDKIKIPVNSVQ